MMALAVTSATRRRNVMTRSSILEPDKTRVADCSGMSVTPEDGEFIKVLGGVGSRPTTGSVFVGANDAALAVDADNPSQAMALRMVWGHALASDRQVTGSSTVAYFNREVEVDVELYGYDDGDDIDSATNYAEGRAVSVIEVAAPLTIEGSSGRFILYPGPATIGGDDTGWVVGHVTKAPSAIGDPVRIQLLHRPIKLGAFA